MIPFSVTCYDFRTWRQWAKADGREMPEYRNDFAGALKALTPFVGKLEAAAMTQLGFIFDEPYEIPGVRLVRLDQRMYLGQAPVLHWLSLNDEKVNSKLRSIGILSWWTS